MFKKNLAHNKTAIILVLFITLVVSLFIARPIFATKSEAFYNKNNILFLDLDDTSDGFCVDSGGNISNLGDLQLTSEGTSLLNNYSRVINQKIAESIVVNGISKTRQERYIEAVNQAGLPSEAWMLLATVDYRERSWGTEKTILNGRDSFGSKTGTDFTLPGKDYQDDLLIGANHLITHAKAAGFDLRNKNDWTTDRLAETLLRWNRGNFYKDVGLSWKDSGFVVNFTTSYQYNGLLDSPGYCKKTATLGSRYHCDHKETRLGGLVVLKYLNDNLSSGNLSSLSSGLRNCRSSITPTGVNPKLFEVFQQYAWPEFCRAGESRLPACDARNPKAGDNYKRDPILLQYTGANYGQDCGAWVRFAMIKSGIDPTYGGGSGQTAHIKQWLSTNPHWRNIGNGSLDTASLRSGDVAVCTGHTFFYLGNGIFSSASLNERYPMGTTAPECGNKPMTWWRRI